MPKKWIFYGNWMKKPKQWRTYLKWAWFLLASTIIFVAILFTTFRALTPWASQYKEQIEAHLSALIGQPVAIKNMQTGWYWFKPVLRLNEVSFVDNNQHQLIFQKLLIGINILGSLRYGHIQPGILVIDNLHMTLRQQDNGWQIEGLLPTKTVDFPTTSSTALLQLLLAQQKINLRHVTLHLYLKDGSLVPISHLNAAMVYQQGHYYFKASAKLAQTVPTEFSILANMYVDEDELTQAKGEVYIAVDRLLLAQWQSLLPIEKSVIQGGEISAKVWLTLENGLLQLAQSHLRASHVSWRYPGDSSLHFLQALNANLAWKPTADGWQLSGDKIHLRLAGQDWLENKLLLQFSRTANVYQVYLKYLRLGALKMFHTLSLKGLDTVISAKPHGELNDTQLILKEKKPIYFLSHATHLGWPAIQGRLGIDNLAGVVYWQPDEGRLELDAQDVMVKPFADQAIHFAMVNGGLSWKQLSHGTRITLDHFVMMHPELIFSATGMVDNPWEVQKARLHLKAEISADNATQWLHYLPSLPTKPKLSRWLKNDIQHIDKMSGELTLDGKFADFPFDEANTGTFSTRLHVSGAQLYFNRRWPMAEQVEADVRLSNRQLITDVSHMQLGEMKVDEMNLRIDGIGLGKETLLLHGKTQALAKQGLDYLRASPLSAYFSRLNLLTITEPIAVDMRLQVPLYPGHHDVFVRGQLAFNDNQVMADEVWKGLKWKNIHGLLHFDEHGIIGSELDASFFDGPAKINIYTVHSPKPYTAINLKTQTSTTALYYWLKWPLLTYVHGSLKADTLVKFTQDTQDFDTLLLTSSLNEVAIDLPEPFAKATASTMPFSLALAFNAAKTMHIQGHYADKISTNLWFTQQDKKLTLQRGEIRLGSQQALESKHAGLQILGTLPIFPVNAWQSIGASFPVNKGSGLLSVLRLLDVKVDALQWGKHVYVDTLLTLKKQSSHQWFIHLKQENIEGQLNYDTELHALDGHFRYLQMDAFSFSNHSEDVSNQWHLHPQQLPNLHLFIDELKLGSIALGQMTIHSTSKPKQWHLNKCQIKSPGYLLDIEGDWLEKGTKPTTHLQGSLHIEHLAETLKRWHKLPVVEARRGDVIYDVQWPGALYEWTLPTMTGQLGMHLSHGRITHLSEETEEKLALGKLLSILSLQTIPRRLTLDFSDLSKNGYSYDTFQGHFTLNNGVMYTKDSYIDGPVAYASMKGELDIIKQLYDMKVHISPHITASLPIVATIAGGPIAGIATWVASKIINHGMQKISGYTYKVTGPWQSPIVQQVNIIRKISAVR